MTKIKVIDSIMGAGKTSFAIQMMNETDKKYLYITPFLTEIDRIIKDCPNRSFVQPEKDKYGSKTPHLKVLLAEGQNIASTHSLFERIDDEAVRLIKSHGYILVLDEVMDVIQEKVIKQETLTAMLRANVLDDSVRQAFGNGEVVYLKAGKEKNLDAYNKYQEWADSNRLIRVNGKALMWLFPADVFNAFTEIYNLTYLFHGQFQKAYFDTFGLDYEILSVYLDGDRYKLTMYNSQLDAKVIRKPIMQIAVRQMCQHRKWLP